MSGPMTAVHSVTGFFAGLWKDRARVAASFFGAWILWFLIGERIEESDEVLCPVRFLSAGEVAPPGSGLFIHVPDELVVLGSDRAAVPMKIVGMKEQISNLNRVLRGDMNLSPDFCNDRDQRTGAIQIGSEFTFPKIGKRSGLRLEDPGTLELTVSRRGTATIPLHPGNLVFGSGASAEPLGEGYEVTFVPSFIDVAGPIQEIVALEKAPDRLRLTAIGDPEDYANGRSLLLRNLSFVDAAGQLQASGFIRSPDHDVLVTIRRERSWRAVSLKNVPLTEFIPETARRANVVATRPVKLDPARLDVDIRVPEEYFEKGNQEGDLNRDILLFVNLAEMQAGLEAQRLPILCYGLPEGATYEFKLPPGLVSSGFDGATADVAWQLIDDS